jgi:formylglycine-generating enzyme required for sulfatase activity
VTAVAVLNTGKLKMMNLNTSKMKRAASLCALLATALAAGSVIAAEPAAARADWPLWDGKESVSDYAQRAGIQNVQQELELGSGVLLKLTLIPAGKFIMGAMIERREGGAYWQTPHREVTISKPYYMGIYEVTQEQFEQVMGADPKRDRRYEEANARDKDKPRWLKGKTHPEAFLTWNEAAQFCEKLSAKTDKQVWLPTEAQWEYACRAGSTTRFPWGDDPADVHKYVNFTRIFQGETLDTAKDAGGFRTTAPVGSFKPNNFGLYDMLGNVSEWCHDWFTSNYIGAPTLDPAGPGISPPVPLAGPNHVWRGDSFSSVWNWPHTIGRPQHWGTPTCGFRVVVALKSTTGTSPGALASWALGKGEHLLKAPSTSGPATANDETPAKTPTAPADLKLRVPAGCRAASGTQAESYTKSGWAQAIVHEATGMELVYIPAGSFLMGSPDDTTRSQQETERGWIAKFEKPHQVTLTRGFYMGKHEVTQAQWEQVMGSNLSLFKNVGPRAPVDSVSWHDCQTFATKAGNGLRLPTEAEWEYACRAGTESPYASDLNEMGWYDGNSAGTTHAVGKKKPNAWGLYDMHGNVREWCQDFSSNEYPKEDATDPTGPAKGDGEETRILRGGSWADYAFYCRSAARGWCHPKLFGILSGKKNVWEDAQTARDGYGMLALRPDFGCRFVITVTTTP